MKRVILTFFLLISFVATTAEAQTFKNIFIKITNITSGLHFAPVLAATHAGPGGLYQVGMTPTTGIEEMAELGDVGTMASGILAGNGWVVPVFDTVDGHLDPGESISFSHVVGPGLEFLSMAGMFVPSNDGFVGLDSFRVPLNSTGQVTLQLNAYGAGTEDNNEKVGCSTDPPYTGLPIDNPNAAGDPAGAGGACGTGAQHPSGEPNKIHVHPGILGDVDPAGGISDFDTRVHRFLNPVAEVVIFY